MNRLSFRQIWDSPILNHNRHYICIDEFDENDKLVRANKREPARYKFAVYAFDRDYYNPCQIGEERIYNCGKEGLAILEAQDHYKKLDIEDYMRLSLALKKKNKILNKKKGIMLFADTKKKMLVKDFRK